MGRRIADVWVERASDIPRLVNGQLDGYGPWSSKHDYTGADGLVRALQDAGPWRRHFSRVLLERFDAFPVEIAGLLPCFEQDLSVEDVLELLARADANTALAVRSSLARVAPPGHVGATRVLVEHLRAGLPAAGALARVNGAALLDEVEHVPHSWCGAVLLNLDVDQGRAFLLAKQPWPQELHAEILGRDKILWARVPLKEVFAGLETV